MGQGNSRPNTLVTDLWLLVDEEQTLHYGLRRAWRWLEHEQGEGERTGRGAGLGPATDTVNGTPTATD